MNKNKVFNVIALLVMAAVVISVSGCNDESIKVMFKDYEKAGGKIEALKSVAVLDFLGKNPGNGEDITDLVADRIAQMGYMQVMDRNKSRRKLKELGLPTEGVVSPKDAKEIADALGVDALVYGTADASFKSYVNHNYDYGYHYYYRKGKRYRRRRRYPHYRRSYLTRSGRVKLTIHFYDAKINKELGKIELNKGYHKDFYNYHPYGRVYYFDRLKRMPMPSDMEMILIMTDRLMDRFQGGFLPYYISRVRTLAPGVPGIELAKDGKWDEAKKKFEKAYSDTKLDKNVNINLGIYYEQKGNAARAVTYYKKAVKIDPDDKQLQEWLSQAQRAAQAQIMSEPIRISEDEIRFRVADVKADGRVYINAGKEDGINKGDEFMIVRPRVVFYSDLVTPKGTRYFPIADFKVNKVFDGVSSGDLSNEIGGHKPRPGDIVVKKRT